jgi:hypothetical protein
MEVNLEAPAATDGPDTSINPENPDAVRDLALDILKSSKEPERVDARRLLIRPENMSEIQTERFPKAVYRPKT